MNDRHDAMFQAASRYYIQNETMESIAKHLGLSRSTVSRLLKEARDTGLVRITLADRAGSRSPVAESLGAIFGIRVHLVPVRDSASAEVRLDRVARVAGQLLSEVVEDHQVIGVAWGVTIAHVVRHVPRRPLVGATVVQINGGANRRSTGIPYIGQILHSVGDAFDAPVVLFPVPAFFDYPETRMAMWRERSIRHVLDYIERLDVAVFGVGCLGGEVPSHVYTAGYLDAADLQRLTTDGVVGDVSTVLLREDGSYADIEFNRRATGVPPHELRRVRRRICVVGDATRASAVVGALRAGVATDLVIDETSARAVLERL